MSNYENYVYKIEVDYKEINDFNNPNREIIIDNFMETHFSKYEFGFDDMWVEDNSRNSFCITIVYIDDETMGEITSNLTNFNDEDVFVSDVSKIFTDEYGYEIYSTMSCKGGFYNE